MEFQLCSWLGKDAVAILNNQLISAVCDVMAPCIDFSTLAFYKAFKIDAIP